jgi:putative ABC transport system permease protein
VEQQSTETVKYNGTTLEDVVILGSTADFPSVRDMEVAQGRYFNDTEVNRKQKVAVLGSSLATELFGDTNPIGQVVTAGTTKLTVIGVMAEKGQWVTWIMTHASTLPSRCLPKIYSFSVRTHHRRPRSACYMWK